MATIATRTAEMSREEWLEERRKGIGGSDAAAALGLSKWKTPFMLYLEKTGEIKPNDPGEAAYWGTRLEDIVAEEFMVRTKKKVRRRNAIFTDPERPWMLANIDREVVGENAGLEVKTTGAWGRDEWTDDRVPDCYLIQAQHYMSVMGWERVYFAVLIGGQKFLWKEVPRDDDLIAIIREREAEFWQRVQDFNPPPVDGSEAASEILGRLYPEGKPGIIDLPAESEALIEQWEAARAAEAEAKARKDEAANRLKEMLKDNERGGWLTKEVVWKNVTQERVDAKALKERYPDVYNAVCKTTTYRKFDIKEAKG